MIKHTVFALAAGSLNTTEERSLTGSKRLLSILFRCPAFSEIRRGVKSPLWGLQNMTSHHVIDTGQEMNLFLGIAKADGESKSRN